MEISANQISLKERIGHIDNNPIWNMTTKGGLVMLVMMKGGAVETLAVAPHQGLRKVYCSKEIR